jgi:hypothetical protein
MASAFAPDDVVQLLGAAVDAAQAKASAPGASANVRSLVADLEVLVLNWTRTYLLQAMPATSAVKDPPVVKEARRLLRLDRKGHTVEGLWRLVSANQNPRNVNAAAAQRRFEKALGWKEGEARVDTPEGAARMLAWAKT